MLCSPLDQFRILPLLNMYLGNIDVSVTNTAVIMILSSASFLYVGYMLICPQTYLDKVVNTFVVPNNRWFLLIENIYTGILSLVFDNVGPKGQFHFPFILTLFVFVLQNNLIGLIPYSFTPTSHIILTFGLALMVFVGVIKVGKDLHNIHFLNLFLPSGTALPLAFLLVPLEIVSFLSKPISLSVRLFANMMAGHTLLKVIAGFAWNMMQGGGLLFVAHALPLVVLFLLVGLELGVGIIQAYVFIVLSCIYLNDSINLH